MMASNAKGVATGTREATSAMGGKVRAAPRLTPACTCRFPALLTCFDYTVLYTLLATRSAAPTRGPSSSRGCSGTREIESAPRPPSVNSRRVNRVCASARGSVAS